MNTKKPTIFFDRDGVINECVDRGDNCFVQGKKVRWTAPWTSAEFRLIPGVAEALKRLHDKGFVLILVSNQPDLAYKTLTTEEHEKIMAEIKKLPFDDIYICPHGRTEGCECKKPKPGMFLAAAKKWDIDLTKSMVVGDTKNDIEAARAIGAKIILLDAPYNSGLQSDARISRLEELVVEGYLQAE